MHLKGVAINDKGQLFATFYIGGRFLLRYAYSIASRGAKFHGYQNINSLQQRVIRDFIPSISMST